jgi:hypothetical protein
MHCAGKLNLRFVFKSRSGSAATTGSAFGSVSSRLVVSHDENVTKLIIAISKPAVFYSHNCLLNFLEMKLKLKPYLFPLGPFRNLKTVTYPVPTTFGSKFTL